MGHDPKLIEALRVIKTKLEATPEPLRGPFLVKGLAPYTQPAHPKRNPVSDDLVERLEVGTVVGFMHPTAEWCHKDYSAIAPHCQNNGPGPVALIRQSEAAAQIAALSAANKALMDERASIIATKREQIDLLNSRATAAEAQLKAAREALEFVHHWTWYKEGRGSTAAERLDVIKHYPPIAALNPKAPSE